MSNADASGAKMYQQQGTWFCHQSRVKDAKKWDVQRGVASADALIVLGKKALASRCSESADASKPAGGIGIRHDGSGSLAGKVDFPKPKKMMLLRVLLSHIDPDCDYDRWCRAGMALYTETRGSKEGLALFDEWSSAGTQKYAGSASTEAKWRSFSLDVENPCKIGTLFHFAKENGFPPEMIYTEVEWLANCGGHQDEA